MCFLGITGLKCPSSIGERGECPGLSSCELLSVYTPEIGGASDVFHSPWISDLEGTKVYGVASSSTNATSYYNRLGGITVLRFPDTGPHGFGWRSIWCVCSDAQPTFRRIHGIAPPFAEGTRSVVAENHLTPRTTEKHRTTFASIHSSTRPH